MLELIYAVKGLATNVEVMHQDLRRFVEEESYARDKELDKIKEIVSKNHQILNILPISTADRLDKLIDKKVDGVLEDVRTSLHDVRQKLLFYTRTKDAIGAIPAAVADPMDDITGSFQIKKDEVHLRFKTDALAKFWSVFKWVAAALAAGGGGWAIIKNLLKS